MKALNVFNRTNLAEIPSVVEDETLVYVAEAGYDTGEYSNIKVSYGWVDVRTLSSEVDTTVVVLPNGKKQRGYQRELKDFRLEEIINNYHITRLDPITISIRDGKRNTIDGQCRVTALQTLHQKGLIDSPMVFCKILNHATKQQESLLYARQDDGKTQLKAKEKTSGELGGEDPLVTSLENCLNTYGLTLDQILAHKTLKDFWRDGNRQNFQRVCNVISKSWSIKEIKKSVRADIWRGLMCFYDCFSADIDDKRLITKLSQTTSDSILSDYQKYAVKADSKRKYLKTYAALYNVSKRVGLIDYR